jgi:hypothetical protein
MSADSAQNYLIGLVSELRKLPAETGGGEFKQNNENPEEIDNSSIASRIVRDTIAEGFIRAYVPLNRFMRAYGCPSYLMVI